LSLNLGACVDCSLCVQVCPTGIDIRDGLQYECIGCGACADVCDTVMDKMGYARGLVKYSTQNAINQHWSHAQILRQVLRSRVLVYTAILGAVVLAMVVSLTTRAPFMVDVVRDRGSLARITNGGHIENVYRLQIMNATESIQRFYISVEGLDDLKVVSEEDVTVESSQSRWVAVRVQAPYESAKPGSHTIHFEVQVQDAHAKVSEKSVFIVPR
jgi:cytochrome c oxidase accessory protein FixG